MRVSASSSFHSQPLPEVKLSELSDWLPDQWKIRHLARMASFNSASAR